MRQAQKVDVPKGWPKWKGETHMLEWRRNNNLLFPPKGMTNRQWVESFFKMKPGETEWAWLVRLAAEPIASQLLSEVKPFTCDVGDIHTEAAGRLVGKVFNLTQALEWGRLIGWFMDERVFSLKSIGYLFDQREERMGRYGRSMMLKNIWHFMMLKLGIDSRLILNLQGNSFCFSNTVTPNRDYVLDAQHQGYRERNFGPWPIMVTSHVVTDDIAVTDSQFGAIRLAKDATAGDLEKQIWAFKWQVYKLVFLIEIDYGKNEVILRACVNPKTMVDRGLVSRPSIEEYVFFRPDQKLDENGRNVTYMKEVGREKENHDQPIREYRAKIDEQTWEPIHLLKKLQGFDPRLIHPEGK